MYSIEVNDTDQTFVVKNNPVSINVLTNYVITGDLPVGVVSVNGKSGTVVLNTDDLSDTGATHKFATDSQINDIALNTASRHSPVTVTDSSEIDLSITGQDITASLVLGSIDESKLDTSVNASLDLADSSVQQFSVSVTDNTIARYNGTTGRSIQSSAVSIDDSNTVSGVNAIHLSTSPTGTHTSAGQVVYNPTDRSLDIGLGNGVIANALEEIFTTIQNDTGATIADGSVVAYGSSIGASGNIRGILAVNNTTNPSYILGIATEDIANGSRGKVTRLGTVRGINTSAFTAGDILYLSSSIAGGLTNTPPSSPYQIIPVGICTVAHAVNGTILVNPRIDVRVATVPTTATSFGYAGQIAYDATYFYICIATNTWRRIAHSTW